MSKRRTRIYSDFDLSFGVHPLTGDISMKYDEDAVKRSIQNIVMYNMYEKPFNPNFGSDLRNLLFENITRSTALAIKTRLEFMIQQFEPRVDLIDVKVEPNELNNGYDVTLEFSIVNILEPIQTRIFLQRIR